MNIIDELTNSKKESKNKVSNLDFILFAVNQTIKALEFGFTLNECRRNLNTALHQYWQNKTMNRHNTNHRHLIKKSKNAIIAEYNFEKTEVEHAVPLKIIVDELLKLDPLTSKNIEKLLINLYRVCIVSKSEHEKLSVAKLRSKMPDDWDRKDPYARYKKVGIECDER